MSAASEVVDALLYEGYVLWPYRRSALKNRQRWTIGAVLPLGFARAAGGHDRWRAQTQVLVTGASPVVDLELRFLHVVERLVGRRQPDGTLVFPDELAAGPDRLPPWEEAAERAVSLTGVRLNGGPASAVIRVPAGESTEAPDAGPADGVAVRRWNALHGSLAAASEPVAPDTWRLTVALENLGDAEHASRAEANRAAFVSAHVALRVSGGGFVSLLDPPTEHVQAAKACRQDGLWPVLVGQEGATDEMLASPIILYDYPRVAPESPGPLFDNSEIDQLLVLNILALTDAERDEVRATDPRVRELLERAESLSPEAMAALNGVMRDVRMLRPLDRSDGGDGAAEAVDGAGDGIPADAPIGFRALSGGAPPSTLVAGGRIVPGSLVRIDPRPGRDALDAMLRERLAIVEAIEQDAEDRVHIAVSVADDPGRALAAGGPPGHRFYFAPDELRLFDPEAPA